MDLKLPHLGEGADSGTVVNLLVKEGDQITKDQPILELENEKAVATIPSNGAGTVTKIFIKAGDKITVGQRILSMTENGAGAAEAAKPKASAAKPALGKPAAHPEAEPEAGEEAEAEETEAPQSKPGGEPAASPSIRKLARELGIDLGRVRGSERGGRIVMDDVRAYIQRLQKQAATPKTGAASASPAAPKSVEAQDFSKWGEVSRKAFSPLRQVIARRMLESRTTIPHVTQFDAADITVLLDLRKKYAPAYEQKGARLTLTSFALRIVAETLKNHPIFNSSLDEATQEIVLKEYFHIGVAVDSEAGLMVPVIRDVNKKNLVELSRELEEIAKKARDRKISGDDMKGGTFTISNQGGIGGGHFTPIINKPEVAILGLGRGALRPTVREGRIEPRSMLPIALSYDHRVIDGGMAARFTVDLVKAFENFSEELVKI
jgi:pyruvate dehydrogenase E2 component (dihydrolipoamide acetyltransferase)